ncbi:MAG: DUF2188 domain-containing protein [Gemmatimonadaceae bacterium]
MPKHGPNVWVVRRGAGFSITEERTGTHLVPPIAQRKAVAIARCLAIANGSELIVQGRSTRIRFRDSHGSDPYRARS